MIARIALLLLALACTSWAQGYEVPNLTVSKSAVLPYSGYPNGTLLSLTPSGTAVPASGTTADSAGNVSTMSLNVAGVVTMQAMRQTPVAAAPNACDAAHEGQTAYNSTAHALCYCNGNAWKTLAILSCGSW